MKKSWLVPLFSLTTLLFTHSSFAAQTCGEKEAALKAQLNIAESHNNAAQVRGIKKALNQVQTHCTAESVRTDAEQDVQKLQRKLDDKHQDLREAKHDLQRAISKDDRQKIEKYQREVVEEQHDIATLNQQLTQAKKSLSDLK